MEIIYLSGLPRSGSTLLCNVLNNHSQIEASTSSPLCNIIQAMKSQWTNDPFLLSQLDDSFEKTYERLKRSTKAFINSWVDDTDVPIKVNKNRAWLVHVEFLRHLYPNFKIIVTLRDLKAVYASIENQHRKTLLLNLPGVETSNVDERTFKLFDKSGVIGSCIENIKNLMDIPDILPHVFYWKYEDFIEDPQSAMDKLYEWLGVDSEQVDTTQTLFESDSHYGFKYLHKLHNGVKKPHSLKEIKISPRILKTIEERYEWYYKTYYENGSHFQ